MGKILNMADYLNQERDPAEMDTAELKAYLEELREKIAELDAQEPEDMESEAYEIWGERHEDLEDLVDEVLDLLDERN